MSESAEQLQAVSETTQHPSELSPELTKITTITNLIRESVSSLQTDASGNITLSPELLSDLIWTLCVAAIDINQGKVR